MKSLIAGLVLLTIAVLTLPTAAAHAPLGSGSNESLATATPVPDPTKSWAIYADLHEGGEAQYYRFDAAQGLRIHLSLLTTTAAEDANFTPSLTLMGPGIANASRVPDYVEIPANGGAITVNGTRAARATYEAFSPSAFVALADLALPAPSNGTYYVAVHDPVRGGHYALVIGDRESFTVTEWALTPFSLLAVYEWEHQSLLVVLSPALLVTGVGLGGLLRRHRSGHRLDATGWAGAAAGLLFLGTGATVASQMVFAIGQSALEPFVLVTLTFATLPMVLGLLSLRLVLRNVGRWTRRSRIYLILIGAGAVVAWAGFVVGPMLAVSAAFLPKGNAVAAVSRIEA